MVTMGPFSSAPSFTVIFFASEEAISLNSPPSFINST
jgi:hypothetical protein